MCTNSARLVNSLECYMDDLVDCFEDFVKKSLFIISIAVGALILMLGYVMKVVTERPDGQISTSLGRAAIGSSAQDFSTPKAINDAPNDRRQSLTANSALNFPSQQQQMPTTNAAQNYSAQNFPIKPGQQQSPTEKVAQSYSAQNFPTTPGQQQQLPTGNAAQNYPSQMPQKLANANAAQNYSAQNFPAPPKEANDTSYNGVQSAARPQTSVNSVTMPNGIAMNREFRTTSSVGANTGPMSGVPSFDEKVLRNVGLSSCSKSCMQGKRSIIRNCSGTRIVIPSIPNCMPNHHLSISRPCAKYVLARNSCCSMCCDDDDGR